jgi:DNA-binding MarR family transcriptional regulator
MNPGTVSEDTLQRCERALWRTLPAILHANRQLTQQELFSDDLQLTPAQFHILRNIHRGAKSLSDIAASERVSLPAISRHVDDLVNLGLVSRTRGTTDRRSILLEMTEKGQTAWKKMGELKQQLFFEKLKNLNTSEIEAIIQGLDLLYKAFANDESAECVCQTEGE